MRKNFLVTVIVMMMTVFITLLSGCGEKGSEMADNGEISEKKLKKADTISEFFSKGKHYACYTTGYSKDSSIDEIYFFDDGKVTVLPGDAYGCKLGDLAQMSDKEIWSKYEEAKEDYKAIYLEEKKVPTEQIDEAINVLTQLKGQICSYLMEEGQEELVFKYIEEVLPFIESNLDVATYEITDYVDEIVATDIINKLNILKNLQYKGPFYDVPVTFAIETDGTGNATEKEHIYMPQDGDYFDENGNWTARNYNPKSLFLFEIERGGIGGETQIYDQMFFYYKGANGRYFCTTETIRLDDVKSKNCLVDPSEEEKKALFKDIMDAR